MDRIHITKVGDDEIFITIESQLFTVLAYL